MSCPVMKCPTTLVSGEACQDVRGSLADQKLKSSNYGLPFCKIIFANDFFFFWLRHIACGILVLQPGIKPVALAVEGGSSNHWTARQFPKWWGFKNVLSWDFPGSPVVKTPCFQRRGHGLDPWSGTKIPYAVWHGRKQNKIKILKHIIQSTQRLPITLRIPRLSVLFHVLKNLRNNPFALSLDAICIFPTILVWRRIKGKLKIKKNP